MGLKERFRLAFGVFSLTLHFGWWVRTDEGENQGDGGHDHDRRTEEGEEVGQRRTRAGTHDAEGAVGGSVIETSGLSPVVSEYGNVGANYHP